MPADVCYDPTWALKHQLRAAISIAKVQTADPQAADLECSPAELAQASAWLQRAPEAWWDATRGMRAALRLSQPRGMARRVQASRQASGAQQQLHAAAVDALANGQATFVRYNVDAVFAPVHDLLAEGADTQAVLEAWFAVGPSRVELAKSLTPDCASHPLLDAVHRARPDVVQVLLADGAPADVPGTVGPYSGDDLIGRNQDNANITPLSLAQLLFSKWAIANRAAKCRAMKQILAALQAARDGELAKLEDLPEPLQAQALAASEQPAASQASALAGMPSQRWPDLLREQLRDGLNLASIQSAAPQGDAWQQAVAYAWSLPATSLEQPVLHAVHYGRQDAVQWLLAAGLPASKPGTVEPRPGDDCVASELRCLMPAQLAETLAAKSFVAGRRAESEALRKLARALQIHAEAEPARPAAASMLALPRAPAPADVDSSVFEDSDSSSSAAVQPAATAIARKAVLNGTPAGPAAQLALLAEIIRRGRQAAAHRGLDVAMACDRMLVKIYAADWDDTEERKLAQRWLQKLRQGKVWQARRTAYTMQDEDFVLSDGAEQPGMAPREDGAWTAAWTPSSDSDVPAPRAGYVPSIRDMLGPSRARKHAAASGPPRGAARRNAQLAAQRRLANQVLHQSMDPAKYSEPMAGQSADSDADWQLALADSDSDAESDALHPQQAGDADPDCSMLQLSLRTARAAQVWAAQHPQAYTERAEGLAILGATQPTPEQPEQSGQSAARAGGLVHTLQVSHGVQAGIRAPHRVAALPAVPGSAPVRHTADDPRPSARYSQAGHAQRGPQMPRESAHRPGRQSARPSSPLRIPLVSAVDTGALSLSLQRTLPSALLQALRQATAAQAFARTVALHNQLLQPAAGASPAAAAAAAPIGSAILHAPPEPTGKFPTRGAALSSVAAGLARQVFGHAAVSQFDQATVELPSCTAPAALQDAPGTAQGLIAASSDSDSDGSICSTAHDALQEMPAVALSGSELDQNSATLLLQRLYAHPADATSATSPAVVLLPAPFDASTPPASLPECDALATTTTGLALQDLAAASMVSSVIWQARQVLGLHAVELWALRCVGVLAGGWRRNTALGIQRGDLPARTRSALQHVRSGSADVSALRRLCTWNDPAGLLERDWTGAGELARLALSANAARQASTSEFLLATNRLRVSLAQHLETAASMQHERASMVDTFIRFSNAALPLLAPANLVVAHATYTDGVQVGPQALQSSWAGLARAGSESSACTTWAHAAAHLAVGIIGDVEQASALLDVGNEFDAATASDLRCLAVDMRSALLQALLGWAGQHQPSLQDSALLPQTAAGIALCWSLALSCALPGAAPELAAMVTRCFAAVDDHGAIICTRADGPPVVDDAALRVHGVHLCSMWTWLLHAASLRAPAHLRLTDEHAAVAQAQLSAAARALFWLWSVHPGVLSHDVPGVVQDCAFASQLGKLGPAPLHSQPAAYGQARSAAQLQFAPPHLHSQVVEVHQLQGMYRGDLWAGCDSAHKALNIHLLSAEGKQTAAHGSELHDSQAVASNLQAGWFGVLPSLLSLAAEPAAALQACVSACQAALHASGCVSLDSWGWAATRAACGMGPSRLSLPSPPANLPTATLPQQLWQPGLALACSLGVAQAGALTAAQVSTRLLHQMALQHEQDGLAWQLHLSPSTTHCRSFACEVCSTALTSRCDQQAVAMDASSQARVVQQLAANEPIPAEPRAFVLPAVSIALAGLMLAWEQGDGARPDIAETFRAVVSKCSVALQSVQQSQGAGQPAVIPGCIHPVLLLAKLAWRDGRVNGARIRKELARLAAEAARLSLPAVHDMLHGAIVQWLAMRVQQEPSSAMHGQWIQDLAQHLPPVVSAALARVTAATTAWVIAVQGLRAALRGGTASSSADVTAVSSRARVFSGTEMDAVSRSLSKVGHAQAANKHLHIANGRLPHVQSTGAMHPLYVRQALEYGTGAAAMSLHGVQQLSSCLPRIQSAIAAVLQAYQEYARVQALCSQLVAAVYAATQAGDEHVSSSSLLQSLLQQRAIMRMATDPFSHIQEIQLLAALTACASDVDALVQLVNAGDVVAAIIAVICPQAGLSGRPLLYTQYSIMRAVQYAALSPEQEAAAGSWLQVLRTARLPWALPAAVATAVTSATTQCTRAVAAAVRQHWTCWPACEPVPQAELLPELGAGTRVRSTLEPPAPDGASSSLDDMWAEFDADAFVAAHVPQGTPATPAQPAPGQSAGMQCLKQRAQARVSDMAQLSPEAVRLLRVVCAEVQDELADVGAPSSLLPHIQVQPWILARGLPAPCAKLVHATLQVAVEHHGAQLSPRAWACHVVQRHGGLQPQLAELVEAASTDLLAALAQPARASETWDMIHSVPITWAQAVQVADDWTAGCWRASESTSAATWLWWGQGTPGIGSPVRGAMWRAAWELHMLPALAYARTAMMAEFKAATSQQHLMQTMINELPQLHAGWILSQFVVQPALFASTLSMAAQAAGVVGQASSVGKCAVIEHMFTHVYSSDAAATAWLHDLLKACVVSALGCSDAGAALPGILALVSISAMLDHEAVVKLGARTPAPVEASANQSTVTALLQTALPHDPYLVLGMALGTQVNFRDSSTATLRRPRLGSTAHMVVQVLAGCVKLAGGHTELISNSALYHTRALLFAWAFVESSRRLYVTCQSLGLREVADRLQAAVRSALWPASVVLAASERHGASPAAQLLGQLAQADWLRPG